MPLSTLRGATLPPDRQDSGSGWLTRPSLYDSFIRDFLLVLPAHQGWAQACRFVALRYDKEPESGEVEQYQLFETSGYTYRVFVTSLEEPVAAVAWFYNQRAGAENLIKEVNNDAGLAAHPSRRFDMNRNHFQLAMLAYNLNCWLLLFHREAQTTVESLRHTRLATARLRFLFVAAKIWRHAGRSGLSYSDHYQEQGVFQRLLNRLRAITPRGASSPPGGGGRAHLRAAPCIKFHAPTATSCKHGAYELDSTEAGSGAR